jgi:hypothetical protein
MSPNRSGQYRFTPPRDKSIRFPPPPRDNFQNYAGLQSQNDASQPYPVFSRNNKPSTCGFNFTIGAMVARQRFSPVNRYSCDLVAFSSKPKSPAKRKRPDLHDGDRAFKAQLNQTYTVKRPAAYICSGAETPTRVSTRASVTRTASQAARRARESSGSTGRPSLGSTWQAA